MEFKNLKLHTKAWVLSMIAYYDDRSDIIELLKKYVKDFDYFKYYTSPTDSLFRIIIDDRLWFANCGTRNTLAWINNFLGIPINGWHAGFKYANDRIFIPVINESWEMINNLHVKITGQSRGGANSLIQNYLIKERVGKNSESIGFSSPFPATKEMCERLKRIGIKNTVFVADSKNRMSADPIDNIGVPGGRQYGTIINVGGRYSILGHSMKIMNQKIIRLYKEWERCIWYKDALWLSEYGEEIAKA